MSTFANQILLLLLSVNAYLVCNSLVQRAEATTRVPGCATHTSSSQACSANAAAAHATESFGSSLYRNTRLTPKSKGGVRSEFIHRDKLSGSTATTFERLQQAIRRSNARALRIGRKTRAFSTNSTDAAARLLYDFTTPLASDQGEYLMQLQIGTPITTFHAIADTGSDLVWVQCQPCQSCYTTSDPIFDPASSSSYSQLACSSQACQALGGNIQCSGSTCGYVYGYGDSSSTSGDYSTETVTMSTTTGGSVAVSPINFGCGFNNQGTFSSAGGGLVGLGRGPISFISQLSSVVQEKFSYCLVSFGDSSTTTSPLLFGSAAALSGSAATTPILNAQVPSFYYVGITGIDVGGSALSISSSSFDSSSAGTIFDSGTTLTYFESNAYSTVKNAFASQISLPTVSGTQYGFDLCYDISSQPSFQPPSFTIHFSGASLSPPGNNYFILVASNTLCLALADAGTSGNPSILGNILQQNYHMLYDLGSSSISFQPATCDAL